MIWKLQCINIATIICYFQYLKIKIFHIKKKIKRGEDKPHPLLELEGEDNSPYPPDGNPGEDL